MNIRIAENIRAFRKERRLTQEQLAEALGVTVGAVSKWESGASTPELSLIVAMADFFETSVDVLLGYDWRSGSQGQALERIRALRNEKRFDEASAAAERALLKYPNSFEVVFQSAVQYSLKGMERHCNKSLERALALFARALELIAQNTNVQINEWTIRNNIASVWLCLGQQETALEHLKQNNAAGLNDGDIGYTLATALHRPDEALPYLSDALVDLQPRLFRLTVAYVNAFCERKEYGEAEAVLRWMFGVLDGLRRPGVPSYLDREAVHLLTLGAIVAIQRDDPEAARDCLRRAKDEAKRFDAAPSFGFTGLRFYRGNANATAFDDLGRTAMESIRKLIADQEEDAAALSELWECLEEQ